MGNATAIVQLPPGLSAEDVERFKALNPGIGAYQAVGEAPAGPVEVPHAGLVTAIDFVRLLERGLVSFLPVPAGLAGIIGELVDGGLARWQERLKTGSVTEKWSIEKMRAEREAGLPDPLT